MAAIVSTRILRLQAISPRSAVANMPSSLVAASIVGQGALATANTVNTSTIDASSVTNKVVANANGPLNIGQPNNVSLTSVSITTSGYPVDLITTLQDDNGNAGAIQVHHWINRDGTLSLGSVSGGTDLGYTWPISVAGGTTGPMIVKVTDTPAAGTHTYYSLAQHTTMGGVTVQAYGIVLQAQEVKR